MDGVVFPSNRGISRLHRGPIGLAIAFSVLLHVGWLVAASQWAIEGSRSSASILTARGLRGDAPAMVIEWSPPPPEPIEPPPTPAVAQEPPPPAAEQVPLRLGITESDQKADNAMGFNDPTPHAAPPSEVDQPALDPLATPAVPMGTPSAAAPPAEPPALSTPPPAPTTAPSLTRPTAPQPVEAKTASPRGDAETDQPEQFERLRGDDKPSPDQPGDRLPDGSTMPQEPRPASTAGRETETPADGEDSESITEVAPTDQPVSLLEALESFMGPIPPRDLDLSPNQVPPRESSDAPPMPAPVGTAAPQPPGPVGIASEKEADPASKTKPIEVILGRPAAAQGLEIITKRPRRNPFSLVTRATVLPESPVLEVRFNRAGTVAKATVIKSSGSPDVDSPVLAAVYGWTARGKELELLPSDDAQAGITIRVTILLR